MIHAQDVKDVIMAVPVAVSTNAVTSQVDTLGFDYLTVRTIFDTAASTSNLTVAYKLGDGDTSTAHTDIAVFTAGGASGPTIPTAANTSGGEVYRFMVDLKGRKRYIKLTTQEGTAARLGTTLATLSRADDAPDSVTEMGCTMMQRG